MAIKHTDLITQEPAVYMEPNNLRPWIVTWRVFDQKEGREVRRVRRFFFRSRADHYAGRLTHSAPHAPKINRTPPPAYGDNSIMRDMQVVEYYLAEQPNYYGATALFMVMKKGSGTIEILAEKLYLKHGVEIIDALRLRQVQLDHGLAQASKLPDDNDLPGMWSHSDFEGGRVDNENG